MFANLALFRPSTRSTTDRRADDSETSGRLVSGTVSAAVNQRHSARGSETPPSHRRCCVDVGADWIRQTASGTIDWPQTLRRADASVAIGTRRFVLRHHDPQRTRLSHRLNEIVTRLQSHFETQGRSIVIQPMMEFDPRHDLFDQIDWAYTVLGGLHRRYVVLRLSSLNLPAVAAVLAEIRRKQLQPVVSVENPVGPMKHWHKWATKLHENGAVIRLVTDAERTSENDRRLHRRLLSSGTVDLYRGGGGPWNVLDAEDVPVRQRARLLGTAARDFFRGQSRWTAARAPTLMQRLRQTA